MGGTAFEDGSIGLNIKVPRARQPAVAAHEFGHVLEARNVSAYQAIHDYVLANLPEGKFQDLESKLISLGYSMEEITPEIVLNILGDGVAAVAGEELAYQTDTFFTPD